MSHATIFGAGNIGRSFIAPVLMDAGYGITFVDIDTQLISALRDRGSYPVVTVDGDTRHERLISGFDALEFGETAAVVESVLRSDIAVSSVGQRGLEAVSSIIARVIAERDRPIDVVLAENIRNGTQIFRSYLAASLPRGFELDGRVGIVETSIGKMVPTLSAEQIAEDRLVLYAEPYEKLIVDGDGFAGEPPISEKVILASPIEAYVDRKLFIHNLGHAACAYLAREQNPHWRYIWQALDDDHIRESVKTAMTQGGRALRRAYPGVFTEAEVDDHIADLLMRFANRGLGDGIQRVGRDLERKLNRNDRVVGAMRMAAGFGLDYGAIAGVYRAAMGFGLHPDAGDADRALCARFESRPVADMYLAVSTEGAVDELDLAVMENLKG